MDSIANVSVLLDPARSLTLEAASTVRTINARAVGREVISTNIKQLLESRVRGEILDGLRKVIKLIYRSDSGLPYFSSVIKNVANPSLHIKKLVYIYLLHHAESEPDLALLSINAIQKSLSDASLQVRVLALRTMSSIRVPVISQIVSLAIKKGSTDPSPLVRKAAALAIPKCYRLDPSTLPQLEDYLKILLADKQYFVVGPAINAFLSVCPDQIELIHPNYRALVRKLIDMDEWSQISTLNVLITYSRKCFPRRASNLSKNESHPANVSASPKLQDTTPTGEVVKLDPDLESLIDACRLLLSSRSSAVLVSAARCLLSLGRPGDIDSAAGPLVALLRTTSTETHVAALYNITVICSYRPQSLVPYATRFLVRNSDSFEVARLKMGILTTIFPLTEVFMKELIIAEFQYLMHSTDEAVMSESIKAMGRCTKGDSTYSARCLDLLLRQVRTGNDTLIAECLKVIRVLIQEDLSAHPLTVIYLAKTLDTIVDADARSTIIWLVGLYNYLEGSNSFTPDVLRLLLPKFADESEPAKLQILLLAAKVYARHIVTLRERSQSLDTPTQKADEDVLQSTRPKDESTKTKNEQSVYCKDAEHAEDVDATPDSSTESDYPLTIDRNHPIPKLWEEVLLHIRYDQSYKLRDYSRTLQGLFSKVAYTELAETWLLSARPIPYLPTASQTHSHYLIGTSSLVLDNDSIIGYKTLPLWVQQGEEPAASLREEPQSNQPHSNNAMRFQSILSARSSTAQINVSTQQTNKGKTNHGFFGNVEPPHTDEKVPKAVPYMQGKSLDDWLNEDDSGSEEQVGVMAPANISDSDEEYEEYESEESDDDDDNNVSSNLVKQTGRMAIESKRLLNKA